VACHTTIAIFVELAINITVGHNSIINTICCLQSSILKHFCQGSNTLPEYVNLTHFLSTSDDKKKGKGVLLHAMEALGWREGSAPTHT
jgi:hypothetical protein